MKVRFEQSGGWGNPLGKTCVLDTDELPADDAATLSRLVSQAQQDGSFQSRPSPARDAFSYRVTIEAPQATLVADVDETRLPEGMRPLVEFLERRATPTSRR